MGLAASLGHGLFDFPSGRMWWGHVLGPLGTSLKAAAGLSVLPSELGDTWADLELREACHVGETQYDEGPF